MQLWLAIALFIAAGVGCADCVIAAWRGKKKGLAAIAVVLGVIALASAAYAALTLIFVGGID